MTKDFLFAKILNNFSKLFPVLVFNTAVSKQPAGSTSNNNYYSCFNIDKYVSDLCSENERGHAHTILATL